jgi:plasmid stabilization system protein ParE
MNYKLIFQPPALDDLESAYLWVRESAPEAAERWFNGLVDALETLRQFPERCGLAPENDYFDQEIRQLLHGRRSGVYRILFTIFEKEVRVLHIRHAARKPLEPNT